MDEMYVGDIDTTTIPAKKQYTPPKQPHYDQDKTPDFIIKVLQFLVPLLILGLAVGVRFYTKKTDQRKVFEVAKTTLLRNVTLQGSIGYGIFVILFVLSLEVFGVL